MQEPVTVPSMGESITDATISVLLAQHGDVVSEGQELLELETDKVNQVLYAPKAGQVSFSVKVGDVVQVGDIVASLDTAMQPPKKTAPEIQQKPKSSHIQEKKEEPDIETMTSRKMSTLRKTIAKRLVEVKNQTAMLTTFNEVNMDPILSLRSQYQDQFLSQYGVKLGFMSFFVRAVVEALQEYPILHSHIEGEQIITPVFHNIGIAVSTDRGLVVPVVQKAKELSFGQIEQKIAAFAKKAREGAITLGDLSEGSFTITNGGVFGSLLSTPLMHPGQSAILGMHSIIKRPIVEEDQVVIRSMMYLALSYDHRLVDGKEAVLFLLKIKKILENIDNSLIEKELTC